MKLKNNEKWKDIEEPNQTQIVQKKWVRSLLLFTGTFSVALGIIGIFLPILPTTPFLLLAAWCFSRSSQKYYNWLISNRWFGRYIKNYREGKGVPIMVKVVGISILWLTILFSIVFVISNFFIELIMAITAIIITIHIISIKSQK